MKQLINKSPWILLGIFVITAMYFSIKGCKKEEIPTLPPPRTNIETTQKVDSLITILDNIEYNHIKEIDSLSNLLSIEKRNRRVYQGKLEDIDRRLKENKRSMEETPENIQENIDFIKHVIENGI